LDVMHADRARGAAAPDVAERGEDDSGNSSDRDSAIDRNRRGRDRAGGDRDGARDHDSPGSDEVVRLTETDVDAAECPFCGVYLALSTLVRHAERCRHRPSPTPEPRAASATLAPTPPLTQPCPSPSLSASSVDATQPRATPARLSPIVATPVTVGRVASGSWRQLPPYSVEPSPSEPTTTEPTLADVALATPYVAMPVVPSGDPPPLLPAARQPGETLRGSGALPLLFGHRRQGGQGTSNRGPRLLTRPRQTPQTPPRPQPPP